MSGKKYKATGCARLFFVLIILIPAAYFGAKLIGGGEGVPAVDNFIESIFNGNDNEQNASPDTKNIQDDYDQLKKENKMLQRSVDEIKEENEELKKEIDRLKKE